MTFTLSDDQYRRLLVLTVLGEWMANAVRKNPDPAFEAAAERVYAAAKGTVHEALVVFDEEDSEWRPSDELDEEAHALIDEYDDGTFWEELTARMAERDLLAARGERAVRGMRPEQRERALSPIARAYAKEFEERGLDRLRVDERER